MRIEWAFYGLQSLLNFPRMKKADLRSPTKISTLRSLNQLQCGFSCGMLAAFEYLSLLLSLLVEEISREAREVSYAAHPHGGARLGVGAEDEVVLLQVGNSVGILDRPKLGFSTQIPSEPTCKVTDIRSFGM